MPKLHKQHTKKQGKRLRTSKATISKADMLLQPNSNYVVKRNLQGYANVGSDNAGSINTYMDLTASLTASADWGNMKGAYKACRVDRIHIEFIPFIKHYFLTGTTSNLYWGDVCLGYSPDTYAPPGSQYTTLNCGISAWVISDSVHTMSFKPVYNLGTNNGFVDYEQYDNGALFGSLLLFCTAGFPLSISTVFGLRFIYEVSFKAVA